MNKDLRFKLDDKQREEIRSLYASGLTNYTILGRKYGVHAKTIRKVIDPAYKEQCNEFNKQNWRRYIPTKAHHAELMRRYRKRKRENS